MKYNGIVNGSKTMDFATLVTIFGVLEQNLPMLREYLDGYYGLVFVGVAIITAVLRKITTKPLGDK